MVRYQKKELENQASFNLLIMLNKLKTFLFRSVFRTFAQIGWYTPFVMIFKHTIIEHEESLRHNNTDRETILGLAPRHFRGDLDALAISGRYRVLLMPESWQTRLMYLFFPEGKEHWEYQNPPPSSEMERCKIQLQNFYRQLVPRVHRALKIDAVIGHHLRACMNSDWGSVSRELYYPYLIFYREGMFASAPHLRKVLAVRLKRLGFYCTHLVVHNSSSREFCVDMGIAPADKISALGCIRMDKFIRRVYSSNELSKPRQRQMVVCFPFIISSFLLDESFRKFFRDAHLPLVKFAVETPEIDLVFKLKSENLKTFMKDLDVEARTVGIDITKVKNLTFTTDRDAQDLIMYADVICGINTTTILEAALTSKPVVSPYYSEIRVGEYRKKIKFTDALLSLDAATDSDDYIRLIKQGLSGKTLSEDEKDMRRGFFAKYVSNLDGTALAQYEALIANELKKCQHKGHGD